MPQAAFQFGLKMADGRKSHKNLVNKANTKLKNELSSIKVRPFASFWSTHCPVAQQGMQKLLHWTLDN
jgi:RED-like protein C-terminal region